eukprot:GHVH01011835.1.p1 GENE.GHVH01011835.1~~GHVH01011835.1.p1  ORF type:complete len:211 (-),score=14.33 GHVH01011835.1:92-679(-)
MWSLCAHVLKLTSVVATETYDEFQNNVIILGALDQTFNGMLVDTLVVLVDGLEKKCNIGGLNYILPFSENCRKLQGTEFDVIGREVVFEVYRDHSGGKTDVYHTYFKSDGLDYTRRMVPKLILEGDTKDASRSSHWLNDLDVMTFDETIFTMAYFSFSAGVILVTFLVILCCVVCIIPYCCGKKIASSRSIYREV